MGCMLSFQCFASSIQELDGKFYVSPGMVYVAPQGIYVNVDGDFIPVEGISSDSNGIYINNYECRKILCLKCGKYHDSHKPCE